MKNLKEKKKKIAGKMKKPELYINSKNHKEWKKANPRYNSHEEGESYSTFLANRNK